MPIRFVGATIGRPLHLPEFHADNQWADILQITGGSLPLAPTE